MSFPLIYPWYHLLDFNREGIIDYSLIIYNYSLSYIYVMRENFLKYNIFLKLNLIINHSQIMLITAQCRKHHLSANNWNLDQERRPHNIYYSYILYPYLIYCIEFSGFACQPYLLYTPYV